jgi:diguanylate cyclase (GGDEF)-like protein
MRVENDRCLILAAARPEDISASTPATAPVGSYVPTADMAEHLALDARVTRSWQDAAGDPDVGDLPRVRELGERAMIATPFEVGRTTYLLSFASQLPVAEPFDADDHAYIQLLADFFATRIQRAEHSDRLIHHMTHDTLTGLRNRTQFRLDARAQLALHGAGTVAIVSLDGFRAINEEYGHIIGDALLVEVGAALERNAGEVGVAGRLAGDTFGVFLNGVADAEDARRRLSLIHDRFTRPFSTGDREGKEFIPLSATIGATTTREAGASFDQLLSHADTAVFAAKANGRGHLEFYQPGMESEASSRARTATEVSRAVERGEFELYFQPHLDLQAATVSGAEALIRWNHPEQGILLPDAFIPFAEQHGLVRAITRWVLASALHASEGLRRIDPAFRLYFNLSAVDFADAAIVDELRAAARRGTSLANIGVELTETVAMLDLGAATRTVRHLQDLGVRVAIDDFGTGYSALTLLRRLPVDIIKIDRSYTHEVLLDERDAALTEAVIAGGRQLGYETLAEGVESEEQLAWLRARGCRYVQGYAIAPPQPLDVFTAWLRDRLPPAQVA